MYHRCTRSLVSTVGNVADKAVHNSALRAITVESRRPDSNRGPLHYE